MVAAAEGARPVRPRALDIFCARMSISATLARRFMSRHDAERWKVNDMKYLCLIYDDEKNWVDLPPEGQAKVFGEHQAVYELANGRGQFAGGEGLAPVASATVVRVRDGKTLTTDGPFMEVKEQIGGYYLFDCDNLDQALELAAKIPEARSGAVEIRPCMVFDDPGG